MRTKIIILSLLLVALSVTSVSAKTILTTDEMNTIQGGQQEWDCACWEQTYCNEVCIAEQNPNSGNWQSWLCTQNYDVPALMFPVAGYSAYYIEPKPCGYRLYFGGTASCGEPQYGNYIEDPCWVLMGGMGDYCP